MNHTKLLAPLFSITALACGPGVDPSPEATPPTRSQAAYAASGPTLTELAYDVGYHRFAYLMEETGLSDDLNHALGTFTILVPKVEAFDIYMDQNGRIQQTQLALVRGLLEQHVIEGKHLPDELAGKMQVTLLPGVELEPIPDGGLKNVNGSMTAPTGMWWPAPKGNLVEISQVIEPALSLEHELEQAGFHLFIEAMAAIGYRDLAAWDRKATVLAPTDDAMRRVGLTENGIHDPAAEPRVRGVVFGSILEPADLDQVFNSVLRALDGANVWIESVYVEEEQRERETVMHDGAPRAPLSDDLPPTSGDLGTVVPLDGVIDPKS